MKSLTVLSLMLIIVKMAESAQLSEELYIRNHSAAFDRFVKSPYPIQFKIYFFHITNPDEFDKGNRTDIRVLKFEEKGPYVYDEYREKVDVEFDKSGEKVSYTEVKNYKFNANLSGSGLLPTDKVTVINPAFGVDGNILPFILYQQDPNYKTDKPETFPKTIVFTDSVENLAFKGTQALLGHKFFGDQEDNWDKPAQVHTGKNRIEKVGEYLLYNNEPEQNYNVTGWRHDIGSCNVLKGSDGTQFKPDLSKNDVLYAFEPFLCKSIKLVNDDSKTKHAYVKGVNTIRFHASDDNFARTPENMCHCLEDHFEDCPADLLNLRVCEGNGLVNVLASSPYFQPFPENLLKTSLNSPLTNNYDNYGTYVDVEPVTGRVLSSKKRIQLSIQLRKEVSNVIPIISHLPDKLSFVPLVWTEESFEIDETQAQKLKRELSQN